MFALFTFLNFAALVAVIVFIVMIILKKKKGEDISLILKLMLGSVGACVVTFILMMVTVPETESTEETAEAQIVADTTEGVEEKSEESVKEESVEVVEQEEPAEPTEPSIEENEPIEITEEEYLSLVNDAIAGAVGKNENITDVSLNNKTLTISVDITKANDDANIQFAPEEIAVSRASSITDEILELDTSLWDTVVVDFGNIGTVTNKKENVIQSEYGNYFDIVALDDKNESASLNNTNDAANDKDFIEAHDMEIVAAASMALENFIDKKSYKMSLATANWTMAKFDETDTVIAMTDITYKDIKTQYIYVGTLDINSEGKVVSAQPHYLAVGSLVLGDDGYCDETFEKMGITKGE